MSSNHTTFYRFIQEEDDNQSLLPRMASMPTIASENKSIKWPQYVAALSGKFLLHFLE